MNSGSDDLCRLMVMQGIWIIDGGMDIQILSETGIMRTQVLVCRPDDNIREATLRSVSNG